ncbi:DUF2752 domain-containing protein [Pendulispora albinea]|uniref:DUF2752 domain-containing protein n=1 Tax=Pendulispora albinea TaxID=2741071 RepID=A0ABZ2MCM8_9BACT
MQTAGAPRPSPFGVRLAVVALLVGLAAALLFVTSLPATCPMRVTLHVPCPSCGLTRAARLALAGDFHAATHIHPLWFLVLPYVGTLGLVQLAHYLVRGELRAMNNRLVRPVGYVLLTLLMVVWIARFFGAFGGPCPV